MEQNTQTFQIPAYKFDTKKEALLALDIVNKHHGFTFNVSGYDENYIVEKNGYYYIPKDEYTSVLSDTFPETYYEDIIEFPF